MQEKREECRDGTEERDHADVRDAGTAQVLTLAGVAMFYGVGALFLLLFILLWHAGQVLLVMFSSILVAVLLQGAGSRVSHRFHIPYKFALAAVVLLSIAVLGLAGYLLAPHVAQQTDQLIETLPSSIERLRDYVERYSWLRNILNELPSQEKMISAASTMLTQARLVFAGALGVIANIAIILFVGLYLAAQPDLYRRSILVLLPKRMTKRGEEIMKELGDTLWLWMFGKMMAMLVVGICTAIGLVLLDVPLALTLGIVAGLFDFIPYIGPILSGVPATLIAFSQSPTLALYVALLFAVIQMLEGYLLTPFVDRKTVSLPPAFTILAQVLLALPFGLMGVALASPLAAVLYVLITMLYVQNLLGKDVKSPSEK